MYEKACLPFDSDFTDPVDQFGGQSCILFDSCIISHGTLGLQFFPSLCTPPSPQGECENLIGRRPANWLAPLGRELALVQSAKRRSFWAGLGGWVEMDIWGPQQVQVWLTQPCPLQGTLVSTLQEVKPTTFLGVPRVWEKMQDKIKESGAKSSSLRKKVFSWARATGLKVNKKRMLG